MAVEPKHKKGRSAFRNPASGLSEFWGPVRDFLTKRSAYDMVIPVRCVCISLDKGCISVVYAVKQKSEIRVEALKKFSTGGTSFPSPEEVANHTALFFREAGIAEAKTILSIPKEWAVIRKAEFPTSVRESLPEVVSFELDRITPFNADEALYDYILLGEQEKLSILVVAASSDLLAPYQNALKEAGIEVERVTENRTSLAGNKISDPTLMDMLTSGSEIPAATLERASFTIDFPGEREDLPAAAIGGALETLTSGGVNLLGKGSGKSEKKVPVIITLALVMAIFLAWGFSLVSPLKVAEKRGAEIDRQLSIRKSEVRRVMVLKKEVERLQGEISAISSFKDEKPMALKILKEITETLPDSAWLTRLKINDRSIEIRGNAESSAQLLPELESSDYFKKVEFLSPTIRDQRLKSDKFNIKMMVEGGEGQKK